MKNNLKKNFIWNSIGSTVNATTSLFFLITVTRINGVDNAGIFVFAFSTACFLQMIGLYHGRTFQVSNQEKDMTDSDFLYTKFITCTIMFLCAFVFVMIKQYSVFKITIMLLLILFKMVEAFCDSLYAMIQKNEELYKVGISLLVKGVGGLLLFIFIDILTKDLVLAILSLILVNIVTMFFYDFRNLQKLKPKRGLSFSKLKIRSIKKIITAGFFVFIFTFLTQYVVNAPRYAIDSTMTDEFQMVYGIIAMPSTLMILCSQFLVQPFILSVTQKLRDKKMKKFRNMNLKLNAYVFLIGMAAVAGAYVLGIPFLEIVYGINLEGYQNHLSVIMIGAVFYGMSYILSTSLIIMKKNFIQAILFGIVTIVAFFFSSYFVKQSGIWGASLAYFFTMLVLFLLYVIIFTVNYRKTIER